MKRVVLATTSPVVAGAMAFTNVSVSGSAELGNGGAKGASIKLRNDPEVEFRRSSVFGTRHRPVVWRLHPSR